MAHDSSRHPRNLGMIERSDHSASVQPTDPGQKISGEILRQGEEQFQSLIAEVQDYGIFLLDQQGIGAELEPWGPTNEGLQGRGDHRNNTSPASTRKRPPRGAYRLRTGIDWNGDGALDLSDPVGQFGWWSRIDGVRHPDVSWKLTRPMLGIPQLTAMEYAAWRTRKEGGRWRYRLPTDQEWEKAARGVDRRIRVWGDNLIWSFCWSLLGTTGMGQPRTPDRGGIFPFDESVFGVRDFAGSIAEHTISRPVAGRRLTTVRGGHWNSIEEQDFRAASRSTLDPIDSPLSTGIRVVAESTSR